MRWREVAVAILGVVFIATLWVASVLRDGVVAGIIYLVLFLFALGLFPTAIAIFGSAVPNVVAKLHVILGAFAYDHHYLVDLGDRYEWYPGDRETVWIDGEEYDIEGGHENMSVLGWRPFGILRFKDDDTLIDSRADIKAEQVRGTDGGAVTRAEISSVAPPSTTGNDGTWVVDLKRLYDRGVRKFGDMEILERAEEVVESKQVADSGFVGGTSPILELFGGLLLGVITAFVYLTFFV